MWPTEPPTTEPIKPDPPLKTKFILLWIETEPFKSEVINFFTQRGYWKKVDKFKKNFDIRKKMIEKMDIEGD